MKFDNLACTEKDGILHVKLNRPEKRNAINPMVFWDIERCFSEAAVQPGIQAILLSGEGNRRLVVWRFHPAIGVSGTDADPVGQASG